MSGAPEAAPPRQENSAPAGVLAAFQSILVPGETLEAFAIQSRLFSLLHRRLMVGATSGRLIGMTRGLFGGFQPADIRWQDLKEVRIRVGIFGADLTVSHFASPDLAISGQLGSLHFAGLEKTGAQQVYRICQAQEQAWREKRRVRELEELRAKSGGIQLSQPAGGGMAPAAADAGDPVVRLAKAKELLTNGLISDSEYESLKARIIGGL